MLNIVNFSKSYNSKINAVENLSILVSPGDIYGFIGQNGAGKTTTIKACVGILDFTGGDIFINGMSIKDKAIECKKIMAYIPDNPDVYEAMTGIKYLNFICDIFEISIEERKKRINELSVIFEMDDKLNDQIGSYSHGMKQKITIISALVHSPKLMILDEPFVGLDPKAAHTLKELMKKLCSEGGAIFFSTHILEVAEKLCNKVAIIKDGKLVVSGDTKTIRGDGTLEELFLELTE